MNELKNYIINQKPMEVILLLTRSNEGFSLPRLDGLYNRDWPYAYDHSELPLIIRAMCEKEMIECNGCILTKGPNWREPVFKDDNQYSQ